MDEQSQIVVGSCP